MCCVSRTPLVEQLQRTVDHQTRQLTRQTAQLKEKDSIIAHERAVNGELTAQMKEMGTLIGQQTAQLKDKDTTIAAKDSRIRELEEQAVLSIDVSVVCVWIGYAHVHVFMYCLSHIIHTTTSM